MPKYFVAILPPKLIVTEIVKFQKELEAKYGCNHAQRTPPHITVIPPFDCEVEKLEAFVYLIKESIINKSKNGLEIKLEHFQRFDSRTLFVDVAKNKELEDYCKTMKTLFNQQKIIKHRVEKHYFVPHITLANKDINKRDFKAAWAEFKKRRYSRKFIFEGINILEFKKDKWIVKF